LESYIVVINRAIDNITEKKEKVVPKVEEEKKDE
jgi:hypothetical protein